MSRRDAPTIRRKIEEDFFAALSEWLNHADAAGACRLLEQTAAQAKTHRLGQVHDVLVHVMFTIKNNEPVRKLVWSLKQQASGHAHSFAAPLLALQGLLFLRLNDYPMAIKTMRLALGETPFFCPYVAWQGMGIAFYHSGEYDEARKALLKAAAYVDHPHLGSVWLNLGEVYWRLGDVKQARDAYEKTLETVRDPYLREYVRMKLDDVNAPGPIRQSGAIPVETGVLFEQGLERFVNSLLDDKLVPPKRGEELRERARQLAREYELDVKSRLYLERFSPRVVAEILRQSRDLEKNLHRGRLIEEQIARRRQYLTVLKAGMHGYTAHFKYLDLEDQVRFINEFWRRMASVIFRHNGAIDRIQSTSVIAYFGALGTGDDDEAARLSGLDAIRAAFALQDELIVFFKEIKKLFFELPVEKIRREKGGYDLRERTLGLAVGVSTGWCHFGQMALGGRNGRLMVGHAVNIAHRLTEIARPREVLTSQTTHDLVAPVALNLFSFEDVSAKVEIDGRMRVNTLKDYENRPVYRIRPQGEFDADAVRPAKSRKDAG
ncbi:MAG: hypothetical protein C4523_08480 [Myxococcales bacterium]|nr:MAG: hypothetical protein C4523_08480 [Myxococcales bacterium]